MPYDESKDPLRTVGASGLSGCRRAAAVTPNDGADLATYAKVLRCDGGGTLCVIPVRNADDAPVTITVGDKEVVDWLQVRRVLETGTTATGIVAGWD